MPVKTSAQARVASPARAKPTAAARMTALEKQVKLLRGKLDAALARLAVLEHCVAVAPDGSVTIAADSNVHISAGATVTIAAAQIRLDAGIVRASGVVTCDVLQANSVVAASYTPGAGNIA
ncbi:MAG: hypothetical protein HZB57_01430 [Gammaproteobacteria bacterium]|nr:hypothetical protein [Gammaproteobacteria bacterium]